MLRFSAEDATLLRTARGVGPKVIERLEQMGFASLETLAHADASDILQQGARLSGSACWKNSPQARAAVQAAIALARSATARGTPVGP